MRVHQCLPSARRYIVMEDRGLCVPQGMAKEQGFSKVVSLQNLFKFVKIHLGFLRREEEPFRSGELLRQHREERSDGPSTRRSPRFVSKQNHRLVFR